MTGTGHIFPPRRRVRARSDTGSREGYCRREPGRRGFKNLRARRPGRMRGGEGGRARPTASSGGEGRRGAAWWLCTRRAGHVGARFVPGARPPRTSPHLGLGPVGGGVRCAEKTGASPTPAGAAPARGKCFGNSGLGKNGVHLHNALFAFCCSPVREALTPHLLPSCRLPRHGLLSALEQECALNRGRRGSRARAWPTLAGAGRPSARPPSCWEVFLTRLLTPRNGHRDAAERVVIPLPSPGSPATVSLEGVVRTR